MMKLTIQKLYDELYDNLGPQGWWPADDKIEVIIGAILVQNTNWRNVELSLAQLREATQFDSEQILNLSEEALQTLIRPSGFYKNKGRAIISVLSGCSSMNMTLRRSISCIQQNCVMSY